MKIFKFLALLIIAIPLLVSCDTNPTSTNQCVAPVFSPAAGTYGTPQNVTITSSTTSATIYYTNDGTEPTTTSSIYTVPIVVAANVTLKAKAVKDGFDDSQTETATYVINQVDTPVFSLAAGTYNSAQTVSITCATEGSVIHYTINGTEPDATSPTYTAPINVAWNQTVKAKAMKTGWGDSQTASVSYVIYINFATVPAGTFTMGRTIGDGYNDELPTHSVSISAFHISKYEITQTEWFNVMGTNPSNFTGDNSRPVEMVSFYAALVYCNKRSINESMTPAYTINGSTNPTTWGAIPTADNATWNAASCNLIADGYRLPTEAEWEYAARGGVNTPDYLYSGSNDVTLVSWYDNNAGSTTHPVGQKAANGLGLYDMSGNVQEWVWDWYSATYYASSSASNPTGPSSGNMHTIRGGSWQQTSDASRVVFRSYGTPEKGNDRVFNSRLGFRVVRG